MIHYKYWLALCKTETITPLTIKEIFDKISPLSVSIADIFACTTEEIRSEFSFSDQILSAIELAIPLLDSVEEEYLTLVEAGIKVTLVFEGEYPEKMLNLPAQDIPAALYSIGDISLTKKPSATIISGEKTSEKGTAIALSSAAQFTDKNITAAGTLTGEAVTSMQISALEKGGKTIAVIPGGILTYELPKRITELFDPHRVLILSPFSPNEPSTPKNIPLQIMTLCAISKAIFVIELPDNDITRNISASAKALNIPLYTAEYADYPAEAAGNSVLIKNGAIPVRGKKDDTGIIPNLENLIKSILG
jgi:DNA processing protein